MRVCTFSGTLVISSFPNPVLIHATNIYQVPTLFQVLHAVGSGDGCNKAASIKLQATPFLLIRVNQLNIDSAGAVKNMHPSTTCDVQE